MLEPILADFLPKDKEESKDEDWWDEKPKSWWTRNIFSKGWNDKLTQNDLIDVSKLKF